MACCDAQSQYVDCGRIKRRLLQSCSPDQGSPTLLDDVKVCSPIGIRLTKRVCSKWLAI